MLRTQDVSFAYGSAGEILRQISFDLEQGCCLALLG